MNRYRPGHYVTVASLGEALVKHKSLYWNGKLIDTAWLKFVPVFALTAACDRKQLRFPVLLVPKAAKVEPVPSITEEVTNGNN